MGIVENDPEFRRQISMAMAERDFLQGKLELISSRFMPFRKGNEPLVETIDSVLSLVNTLKEENRRLKWHLESQD